MNADSVDEACKSNEAKRHFFVDWPSGERVSNTWVIYLSHWDNVWKRTLIPDVVKMSELVFIKEGDRKASW